MPRSVRCIVRNCNNQSDRDREVKYYAIPNEKLTGPLYSRLRSVRRRRLWVERINKEGVTDGNVKRHWRVCGLHFVSGAPSKAAELNNPDWAPSLNLGYDLPPTSKEDSTVTVKQEAREDSGTVAGDLCNSELSNFCVLGPAVMVKEEVSNDRLNETVVGESINSESSNLHSVGPTIMVKEEVSNDHESYSRDCQEFKIDTSVINMNNKEPPAIDFVRVSMIDPSDGKAAGFRFVNKEAEFYALQEKHADLINRYTSLQKEHADLQTQHVELKKYYNKLRDSLTEAEVDKLELKTEIAKNIDELAKVTKENETLQAASSHHVEAAESYKTRTQQLAKSLRESEKERADLKIQLYRALNFGLALDQLKGDDLLLECYTGLPNYSVLDKILTLVTQEITETSNGLASWQCLFLTLMRLKLYLKLQVLGDRFNVSVSTVQRTFERWLKYLFLSLKTFIKWPKEKSCLKSAPSFLKKVFDERSVFIVECIELFAGKPSKQDGCYSTNKSVKFLVAFTLDGEVAFLSKEWDRKYSDMHITANSGLLEKLSIGDVILANHGFPVGENDSFYCATVNEKDSSSGQVLFKSFPIHEKDKPLTIQRYIKNVTNIITNKFSILQNGLPWEMFSKKQGHDVLQIEEVITVCCALVNLSYH